MEGQKEERRMGRKGHGEGGEWKEAGGKGRGGASSRNKNSGYGPDAVAAVGSYLKEK